MNDYMRRVAESWRAMTPEELREHYARVGQGFLQAPKEDMAKLAAGMMNAWEPPTESATKAA